MVGHGTRPARGGGRLVTCDEGLGGAGVMVGTDHGGAHHRRARLLRYAADDVRQA